MLKLEDNLKFRSTTYLKALAPPKIYSVNENAFGIVLNPMDQKALNFRRSWVQSMDSVSLSFSITNN